MTISWSRMVVVAAAGALLAVVSGFASAGVLAMSLRRTEPRRSPAAERRPLPA
jgi:hypothetical protein